MIYSSFTNISKIKLSLLREENSLDFARYYATMLKDNIYAVTSIIVEILIYNPTICSRESTFVFRKSSTIWFKCKPID